MHILTRKLKSFSAAHRLTHGYVGKCANLHGHDYSSKVTLNATELNRFGFVTDITDITKYFDDWINENLDHKTIVSSADKSLLDFLIKENQEHYIIPNGQNTTVEVLSKHLFEKFTVILENNLLDTNPTLKLVSVEVWETSLSSAIFTD